jgi:aryl-alcohol dehydrogenase-like predicted oxidoreductase/adenylate kinase family enzyme
MRIGLGCMRLSTEPDRDEARALSTLRAALDAGVTVFDTAHAYGLDQRDLGHNERLIGRALREHHASPAVRVVTKCGMRRDGGAWVPDGRAKHIAKDVEESVAALDGVPIDLLLLHAPDPKVSLATTARALVRAQTRGLAARIGVSNVSRRQLEELAAHAPITAVEIALGAHDDLAIRGGVVSYCLERGIEVLAHAPLGGPQRATRLSRDGLLRRIASTSTSTTAIEVFLAYLLAVRHELVPIVGARTVETVQSIARAEQLVLGENDLRELDARFLVLGALRRPPPIPSRNVAAAGARSVVIMMGVPGAGKSRAAAALVADGYERLNRDTLGGTLRGIARRLDDRLRDGAGKLVLDNTYVTRATRNDVVRIAHGHGAEVRCVFFDTPPHEAQINVVLRMIERFGKVLEPGELSAALREDPAALAPSAVQRMTRDLEPPASDEGFAAIDIVPFVRVLRPGPPAGRRPGMAISLDTFGAAAAAFELEDALLEVVRATLPSTACLLFAWRPGLAESSRERARAFAAEVARTTDRMVDIALCTHPAGPPVCWCRPPLPGMWLGFAERHGVETRESSLRGSSTADQAMARALGLRAD